MRRETVTPRPGWQNKLEQLGFDYYIMDGKPYWTEQACYAFSADQIDQLEAATEELHGMCLKAVEHVVSSKLWERMRIPPAWGDYLERVWRRSDPTICGRFDLAYERQQEYQALYSRCAEDAARGQNAATRARQQLAEQYALSARERECLGWCAAGKTAWETGQILGLSEHTVAYHLDKVKRRFGLATRQQVVARAVSLGLVSPPAVPEPVLTTH